MRILVRDDKSKHWDYADSVSTKTETELQQLIIESPSLIPVSDIRDDLSPLVLAVREFGLPGSGNTDAVAFTADGDVAIIECKLATNPEIKRKVIGQIIEYAAFLWEMTYEELDRRVQSRLYKPLVDLVREAVAGDWEENTFRDNVARSLQEGNFILIIVIDQINDELRRIIRYVNQRGISGFTLHALELQRFKSQGLHVLVPHIHGVSTKQLKNADKRKKWTESAFFEEISEWPDKKMLDTAKEIYQWTKGVADRLWFGTGAETGSFTLHFLQGKKTISVFTLYTDGRLMLNYGWLSPQIGEKLMNEFHDRIVSISSFSKVPGDFTKWPSLNLAGAFPSEKELTEFRNAVEGLRDAVTSK